MREQIEGRRLMSYIVNRKRGKNVYVYEVTRERDELTGKSRRKYRYVGILDPGTGEISTPRKERWSCGGTKCSLKPTIREIAAECACSPATVSRALHSDPGIGWATATKIKNKANAMGWVNKSEKKFPFLIVLPNHSMDLNAYTSMLLGALTNRLFAQGHSMMICFSDELGTIDERGFSGIFSIDFASHLAVFFAKNTTIPAVCLNDYSSPIDKIYSVSSDEFSGISLALNALVKAGHSHIALMQGKRTMCEKFRKEGFLKAAAERGVHALVFDENGSTIDDTLIQVLQSGATALILPGEGMTMPALMRAVKNLHLRIPEDFSCVTWEVEPFSAIQTPPLTTCKQDFAGIAEAAVAMMERLLAHKQDIRNVRIPYQFISRGSVARLSEKEES